MTPSTLASLATNPALPAYVAAAHGTGLGLTSVGVLLLAVAIVAGVVAYRRGVFMDGLWGLMATAFVAGAVCLGLGLPRLIDPQGFGLQALVCATTRCIPPQN